MTTVTTAPTTDEVTPEDLETFLRVAGQISVLPSDHPQLALARRATSALFKAAKKQRRAEKRDAINEADRAVVAATATGSPGRIDDETKGIPLVSSRSRRDGRHAAQGPGLLHLQGAVHRRRRVLPPALPRLRALNHAKRDARTDLTGKRALLTGGRAKIGMYIALRLLRDGAHTTITTRFPRDAVRRFAAMPDSADWLHRLSIVGIDLRDPAQVVALADDGRRRRVPSTSSSTTPRRRCAAPPVRTRRWSTRSWRPCPTGRCHRSSPSGAPAAPTRTRSPARSPS